MRGLVACFVVAVDGLLAGRVYDLHHSAQCVVLEPRRFAGLIRLRDDLPEAVVSSCLESAVRVVDFGASVFAVVLVARRAAQSVRHAREVARLVKDLFRRVRKRVRHVDDAILSFRLVAIRARLVRRRIQPAVLRQHTPQRVVCARRTPAVRVRRLREPPHFVEDVCGRAPRAVCT